MNIAFINATRSWGGVKSLTLTLGTELIRRGHQVVVVGRPGSFTDRCRQLEMTVYPITFGFHGNPVTILQIRRLFNRSQPQVVLTNIDKDVLAAGLAGWPEEIPMINILGSPSDLTNRWRHRLIRERFVDIFTSPSRYALAASLKNTPWLQNHRNEVVYHPVDLNRFTPHRGASSQKFRLGVLARLVPLKGIHILLTALSLLPDTIRKKIEVSIAGEGPEKDRLRQQMVDLDLTQRITFLGFIENTPGLLNRLDVVICPSFDEAHCTTLVEAGASGLPVIASAVGGISEVVTDGKTGLLVPAGSPRELAKAIIRLESDSQLRLQLGLAARRHIEQYFSPVTAADAYEALIESLI